MSLSAYFFIVHCRVYFGVCLVIYGGVLYIKLCSLSMVLDCERLAPTFTTFSIIAHGPPSPSLSAYRYKTSWYTHSLVAEEPEYAARFLYIGAFEISRRTPVLHLPLLSDPKGRRLTKGCRRPGSASHGNWERRCDHRSEMWGLRWHCGIRI